MARELKVNGRTFNDFCYTLKGKKVFCPKNEEIFKFELFHKGINPSKILERDSRLYIIKNRE